MGLFLVLDIVYIGVTQVGTDKRTTLWRVHEDVVQVSLAFTDLCVGKAIGIPWNLTPLPILAFLGLSVWMTTRMVSACSK